MSCDDQGVKIRSVVSWRSSAAPQAAARDEVRRAARALWSWTRHVWAEADRAAGALPIAIPEADLLSVVDLIYTWI